ncbi:MAG: DUF166 domain-containing protein [Methanosarcinaceae archaeon]|nr:DUF166 domain-containing protein [Methanosarcinaceae archaeon]
MTTIGVITRGKYGQRLIETIRSKTDFDVVSAGLPADLPEFVEEPAEFLENLDIDDAVFKTDILVTFSLHPDLTPEIARMAGRAGIRALIIAGGSSRAPVNELDKISEEYGIHIEVDDICCNLRSDPSMAEFTSFFGRPVLDVRSLDGKVVEVRVIRGAPCGSTWHMAKKLIGTPVEDAPARAGLLIQQYPCRAVRGQLGGIHESAELHKQAVKSALAREMDVK